LGSWLFLTARNPFPQYGVCMVNHPFSLIDKPLFWWRTSPSPWSETPRQHDLSRLHKIFFFTRSLLEPPPLLLSLLLFIRAHTTVKLSSPMLKANDIFFDFYPQFANVCRSLRKISGTPLRERDIPSFSLQSLLPLSRL